MAAVDLQLAMKAEWYPRHYHSTTGILQTVDCFHWPGRAASLFRNLDQSYVTTSIKEKYFFNVAATQLPPF